jgi:hypothetical protein
MYFDPSGFACILSNRRGDMYTDTGTRCSDSGANKQEAECKIELENFIVKFKNKDGSYSLYDSDRFEDKNAFHEQIAVVNIVSEPSFNLKEGDVGLGGVELDFYTGGWEWDNFDLSLFDFGHAEASASCKSGLALGALASIWSPGTSFSIRNVKISFGAEIGAIGASVEFQKGQLKLKGAFGFGFDISISW